MKKLFIICMLIGLTVTFETQAQADLQQKLKGYVNPEELVTLSETIPFSQAIDIMSKVSEKLTGKKIVPSVFPILKFDSAVVVKDGEDDEVEDDELELLLSLLVEVIKFAPTDNPLCENKACQLIPFSCIVLTSASKITAEIFTSLSSTFAYVPSFAETDLSTSFLFTTVEFSVSSTIRLLN